LATFLGGLPDGLRAVLEVRNPTWHTEEVHGVLREHRACLCVADTDTDRSPAIVPTASFGYFRMRRERYEPADLDALATRIRDQPWEECHVFFKHEDGGVAPALAQELLERFER
jgi:uncharacterized protein YecE (DUF72 family)